MKAKSLLFFFIIGINIFSYSQENSLLANGNWYKISVDNDGIHRISHSDLSSLGINSTNLPVSSIRLFGNGSGMLPKLNSIPRYNDLTENAIQIIDINANGVFESNDYILFFGQSPDRWTFNASNQVFDFQPHLYSDKTYYFLTIDLEGDGKRILQKPPQTNEVETVSSFNAFQVHEKELENLIESGNEWFGERFEAQNSFSFLFNFPNIVTSSPVNIESVVVARSLNPSYFKIKSDNVLIQTLNVDNIVPNYATAYAKKKSQSTTFNVNIDQINIGVDYFSTASNSIGWLDYLQLNARRSLIMYGDQMLFRDAESVGAGKVVKFQLSNSSSNIKIFDVTNPTNVQLINTDFSANQTTFISAADSLKEFIAFSGSSFLSPYLEGKIDNQNLHALDGDIEYVIVSHPNFLSAANRLASFHAQMDGLSSIVVTPNEIYNEFSCGSQDVTAIRDFLKMLYNRNNSQLKYVLLFGDASYDPKNRIPENSNFIPTYQSVNSTNPTITYVTDDFFGLLDPHEGLFNNDLVDIGIGRIPAETLKEANDVVDKIEKYYTQESFGDWRNVIAFVADDGDANDGNTHMWQADSLANIVDDMYKSINIEKFYLDDYQQLSTPGGPRSPDMQEAINYRIEKGALLVNYTGHGGELGWTQERILEVDQINSWNNQNKLSLFMTATCKFSRFDDPAIKSAGEYVLLNPSGGAVALLSTTRLVYSSPNYNLNTKFIKTLFEKQNGEMPRLGDIFKETKILSGTNANNRNFSLLGDPALKLAYPRYKIQTTSIQDTLNALMEVTINGEIQNEDSVRLYDFNGIVYPTVFDKEIVATTLGQQSCTPMPYRIQKSVIYKGKATVENGLFSFSFVVPKDINYDFGKGKISYYAISEDAIPVDASGVDESFIIGGSASNIIYDYDSPELNLFMNNENFISGGTTDENPTLLAFLSDFSGINTVGNGIGHDIVAILDEDFSNPFILNDFYEADIDDYKRGVIEFPFYNLTQGEHTLTLKAWDVFNNSAESTITFFVEESNSFTVSSFLNYPNPFSNMTEFYFEHNKTQTILDITLDIYSISGMHITTINKSLQENGYRVGPLQWNARDQYNNKLAAGIYIANLNIEAEDGDFFSKSIRVILLPEK